MNDILKVDNNLVILNETLQLLALLRYIDLRITLMFNV